MVAPLVVGVDGSDHSLQALDWACDEALRHGVPLRLVYASLWQRYEGAVPAAGPDRAAERVMAENIAGTAAERVRRRAPRLHVVAEVLPEDAAGALLRESRSAFAVVVGHRGRGGIAGLLLGSVGLSVAAGASCPAVVVRGDEPGVAGAHGRVLLGVGDEAPGSEAVRFAFREARARGAVLDVVRAWRRPAHEPRGHPLLGGSPARYHEDRASLLLDRTLEGVAPHHPDVAVRRATAEGPARKVLVARSAAADLLVVGARRRLHGGPGMQLGSVAHTVLHHALCPVAVVPEPEPYPEP
ncbi:universal stress protein [Streptomyces fradiae]|uniref:universal stress protein n=1 Tax=Streptomyces fradiae TaxID=1906 RepID=UPI002941CFB2|nr:universal stress protein [Streptomyces fradiae]WOI61319.1 universal stress protein [Streptomyces fradiae]